MQSGKAHGALNLDAACSGVATLDAFVIFSSVVSSIGNEGARSVPGPVTTSWHVPEDAGKQDARLAMGTAHSCILIPHARLPSNAYQPLSTLQDLIVHAQAFWLGFER